MRFHHLDPLRIDFKGIIHPTLQTFLRICAGRGDSIGCTILINSRTPYDAINVITVGNGFIDTFQDDHPCAFAGDKPVRPPVKGMAAPAAGQHSRPVGGDIKPGCRLNKHTPGKGHIRFSGPQPLAGQMNGHQRTGACRIHGYRRTLEIQIVGDTGGYHRPGIAPHRLGGRIIPKQLLIIHDIVSHINSAKALLRPCSGITAVFQGLPGFFQKNPLLGVHIGCFNSRDIEKRRIELVDTIKKTSSVTIILL